MKGLQVSIIAAFTLAAVSLAGTIYFFTQIEGERKLRLAAEKSLAETQAVVQDKDKQLQEKTQNIASLESQMDEIKAEVRNKNQELTKDLNQIAQSDTKVKDLMEKIRLMDKDNSDLKSRVQFLEKQQADAAQNTTDTTVNPAAAIEQSGSPVPPSSPAAASKNQGQKTVTGRVILVNREYHFIVAGVGKLDGVNLKDQMDVLRSNKVIGKAAVTKLYDSLSSCEILQEGKNQIKEGDMVRIPGKA